MNAYAKTTPGGISLRKWLADTLPAYAEQISTVLRTNVTTSIPDHRDFRTPARLIFEDLPFTIPLLTNDIAPKPYIQPDGKDLSSQAIGKYPLKNLLPYHETTLNSISHKVFIRCKPAKNPGIDEARTYEAVTTSIVQPLRDAFKKAAKNHARGTHAVETLISAGYNRTPTLGDEMRGRWHKSERPALEIDTNFITRFASTTSGEPENIVAAAELLPQLI